MTNPNQAPTTPTTGWLVLSRKPDEAIDLFDETSGRFLGRIILTKVEPGKAKLAIYAPGVKILRCELERGTA